MNIAFFTESNYHGKYNRDFPNARTDVAWMIALDATSIPFSNVNLANLKFDLGIMIVPKKRPGIAFDAYTAIKKICDKVAVMQEGPNWYWQDYTITNQFRHIELIDKVDYLFVHNKKDRTYYAAYKDINDIYLMPSLMIEDSIDRTKLCPPHERKGVMIGGNMCSWYGGMDSFMVARHYGEPIFAPSMGRKQTDEGLIEGITYLPYLNWRDWIYELSKCKVAVHMMRTHAAGTFALNCAYLGISCIGYGGLDTQETLHPNETVKDGDLEIAIDLLEYHKSLELGVDSMEIENIMDNYESTYSESVWKAKMEWLFE